LSAAIKRRLALDFGSIIGIALSVLVLIVGAHHLYTIATSRVAKAAEQALAQELSSGPSMFPVKSPDLDKHH
jgi:hypothetical protein